jgi:formate dehydrogenase subunit delta
MGRDITRQFAHLPAEVAADEVAAHIARFWEPRMRLELATFLADHGVEMDPVLRAAAERIGTD